MKTIPPYELARARARLTEAVRVAIRDGMNEAGMTQAELAKRAGRSQPSVCRVLNGRHDIMLGTVSDLLAGMGKRLRVEVIDERIKG